MVPVMLEVAELKIISSKIHAGESESTPTAAFVLVVVMVVVLHILEQSI